ncbi:restriction endonuclease subunit S [Mycolicibacterium hodleri]|nr:restriction endonuclease subunit S [Mycolicibacterium hodleri]
MSTNTLLGGEIARGLGGESRVKWPLRRSSDLFELRYGKALVASSRRPGRVPVFGTNGQTGTHDTPLFAGPGVIIGRKGAGHLGVHWTDEDYWVIDTAYSLVPDADIDLKYAYYLLKYVGLNHLKHGTSNPSLTREAFGAQYFPVPPIDEQVLIAETLSAIDDKIDANSRTVAQALTLARALFESSLAQGTRTAQVGAVSEFHNRRRVPLSRREREQRPGAVPYYGATGVFGYVDEALFDEILVLVGEDGSVVREDGGPMLQYIWGKAWINNHAHAITGLIVSTELLFLALDRADIRPIMTGAVQAKVSMGNLKSVGLRLPVGKALDVLELALAPVFSLYRSRINESAQLRKTRDALLPELLSGRLRVSIQESA